MIIGSSARGIMEQRLSVPQTDHSFIFALWKTWIGQEGKKVAGFFLIMICDLCFLCLVHLAEDILQKT